MNKNWRFRFLAMLVMAIMTIAVACGTTKESADPADKEVTTEAQEPGETEEPGTDEGAEDKAEEPGKESTDTEDSDSGNEAVGGDEEDANVQTVKGTFGGLADPHTFELKTDAAAEGVMAFQFHDEEIGKKLADMEDGQELTVVYTTNEYGQNLVQSIE